MKFAITDLAALAALQLAVPAQADPSVNRHTSVTQTHGAVRLLPHHKAKYCKWVRNSHHKRVKKCWYH